MSTITKEHIIDYLLKRNNISEISLIVGYCIERGKSESLIRKLIDSLYFPLLYNNFALIALEYYLQKFNIVTIHDKQGRLVSVYGIESNPNKIEYK